MITCADEIVQDIAAPPPDCAANSSTSKMQAIASRWPELLAAIVLVQCAASALLAAHFNVAGSIPWTAYYLLWLIPVGGIGTTIFLAWLARLFLAGEENPTKAISQRLRSIPTRSYVEFVVPILVMAPFLASYTTFKVLMVNFTGYGADPMLARLDGVFGMQPWEVSHALIGPLGTFVLDRLYYAWFLVNQIMLMGILFVPVFARQRAQVLLTFVLVWIVLGSGIALLFSSVGPCYYGHLNHPDAYADLMGRLSAIDRSYPLMSLSVQDQLWSDHTRDALGLGSGVSAMPSMHVSLATIMALLLRRLGLALIGWFWLVAIWIGSFHLGWHYASDGLVSFVVTVAIWKGVAAVLAPGIRTSPEIAAVPDWFLRV